LTFAPSRNKSHIFVVMTVESSERSASTPASPADDVAASGNAPVLLSIEDAEAELAKLGTEEQELELELEKLYNKAAHLCQSESRNLAYVSEQHKQVPAAIKKLQETLQSTSSVADELSGRVRKLDSVCNRVSEALKIVDDMIDLRECSDQVGKAITSEDYEQAAKYIARFRAAQKVMGTGSGTDDMSSIRVLKEAEQRLSGIVRKQFEAAMTAKDNAAVSRFAKLFHPLGLAGEGVQKYIEFIRHSLAESCSADFRMLNPVFGKRADAGPTPYAEALTKVFVAIADVVQEHQQAVEQEFGSENFILVLRGLMKEADVQGLRIVEKFFGDHQKLFEQQVLGDLRDTGSTLEEVALITQRVQQFDTYIRGVAQGTVEMIEEPQAYLDALEPEYSKVDGLIGLTGLMRRIQELVSSYVLVEQAFLLQSVEKAAVETDSLDPTDPEQLTTTIVDDTFFILQQCMLRSITTCDNNAVCAVVNYTTAAIGNEVKNALVANLAESRRLYSAWVSYADCFSLQPGENPLGALFVDQEGRPRQKLTSAVSWPHSLNNLQQCIENLDQLKSGIEEAYGNYFPSDGPEKEKRVMFGHCIEQLDHTKAELSELHVTNCKAMLQMLKGVHLSPALSPLEGLSYNINQAEYEDLQVNDPFAKGFIGFAEVIHRHCSLVLNSASSEEVMQQLADQTSRRLEKTAFSKKFSMFGALQFDSDVRTLCSFFTNLSEQALRHKFARLFEMSNLLNLENAQELREVCGEMKTWRLIPDEIRKLIACRVDFDVTETELEMLTFG